MHAVSGLLSRSCINRCQHGPWMIIVPSPVAVLGISPNCPGVSHISHTHTSHAGRERTTCAFLSVLAWFLRRHFATSPQKPSPAFPSPVRGALQLWDFLFFIPNLPSSLEPVRDLGDWIRPLDILWLAIAHSIRSLYEYLTRRTILAETLRRAH